MRVLLCGGNKTANIEFSLKPKFDVSGDTFIVVKYIEAINTEVLQRGDTFDKAIIFEQGLTRDFEDNDEVSVRGKLAEFADLMAFNRNKKLSYVFVTRDDYLASIIHEEIIPIANKSAIIIANGKYTVPYMSKLVTTDITKFPEDWVYKPTMSVGVDEESVDDGLSLDKIDATADENFTPSYIEEGYDPLYGTPVNTDDEQEGYVEDYTEDSQEGGYADEQYTDEQYGDNGDYVDEGDYTDGGDYVDNGDYAEGDYADDSDYAEDNQGSQFSGDEELEVEDELSDAIEPLTPDYVQRPAQNVGFDEGDYGTTDEYGETGEEFSDDMYDESGQQSEEDDYIGALDDDYDKVGVSDDDYNTPSEDEEGQQNSSEDDVDFDTEQTAKKGLFGKKKTKEQGLSKNELNAKKLRDDLEPFAARGNSIVVTGCGGCGTSTVAFNLANMIHQLGYSVLIVDMDTENKTQSYISRKSYDSMDQEGANLMSAINSLNGINTHVAIIDSGFHLLTMGMAADTDKPERLLHKDTLSRFINMAKRNHNFVIYDMPFEAATDTIQDVVYMADNLVFCMDTSNWGISKALIQICNINSDDMQEIFFGKAQVVFNKYRNLSRVFGKKVKTGIDIVKAMDTKLTELTGEENEYRFADLRLAGLINDDIDFENGWYENVQYSDTKKGQKIFGDLLYNIVLSK